MPRHKVINRGGQQVIQEEDPKLIKFAGDNVYYNISIPHNDLTQVDGSPTPANYFESRTQALFPDSPSDYTMSIVRFTVPAQQIPIRIFPIDSFQNAASAGGVDINLSNSSVTLEWTTFEHQVFLEWNTEDDTATIPTPVETAPGVWNLTYRVQAQNWQYYAMYSINHYVKLINDALLAAYNLLIADGMPASQPPFFNYDASTRLITLYAPAAYLSEGVANPISIYFNTPLYSDFLNSFQTKRIDYSNDDPGVLGKDVYFYVYDRLVNRVSPPSYGAAFAMSQEFNNLSTMLAFTSLIITSTTLPVRSEWISIQSRDPQGIPDPASSNFYKIIADFEVISEDGFETRDFINFLPSAEFRRITLESDVVIDKVDIQIFWKDNYDTLFPLMIPGHKIATLKLLFEKR